MKHRQTFNKPLIVLAVFWFAVAIASLSFNARQYGQLQGKREVIQAQASEIRWLNYSTDKAKRQAVSLPELQFLAQVMETRDRDLFAVAKSAWKWGAVYKVSPFLIMSVAHRESNFNPMARSYDAAGQELAFGIMQINFRVWQKELSLDLVRIDEIDYNVQQGAIILRHYLDRNPGDISRGLWEYWGRGEINTYSPRVLSSRYFEALK